MRRLVKVRSALGRRRLILAIAAAVGALAAIALVVALAGSDGRAGRASGSIPPSAAGEEVAGPRDEWAAVTWAQTVDQPFGPPDPLRRIEGLVATPDGYLAWGRAPMAERNQFGDMAAIFLSGDGTAWETVPLDEGVEAANASSIAEVVAGPAGYLAIGSVCCEPEHPAAWHSPDARTWTRLPVDAVLEEAGTWFQAVAGTPEGWFILGGTGGGGRSVVWFTADGRSWEVALEVDGGPNGPSIQDLAATGGGAVAVGFLEGEDGSYDGAVWASDDGGGWERRAVDDPGLTLDESQLWRVIPHAGGILAVGVHGTAEQRRQCEDALGLAALSPIPPPPPPIDATSCSIGEERVWTSVDGEAWELAVPPAGVGPIEFRVMAEGGPGIVLLGETSAPASPDTVLFASPDGAEWRALVAQPLGQHVANGVAVRGTEVVAITELWTGAEVQHRVWRGVAR